MALAAQPGILAPVPAVGPYLFFSLMGAPHTLAAALTGLAPLVDGRLDLLAVGL